MLNRNKKIRFIGLGLSFSEPSRKEIFNTLIERSKENPLPKDIYAHLLAYYNQGAKPVDFHNFTSNELVPYKEVALALYYRDERSNIITCFTPPTTYQIIPSIHLEGCTSVNSLLLHYVSKNRPNLFLELDLADLKTQMKRLDLWMESSDVTVLSTDFKNIYLAIEMIAFILKENETLKELTINFCQVKDKAAIDQLIDAISSGIINNMQLCILRLESVILSAAQWDKLRAALWKNITLQYVYLMIAEWREIEPELFELEEFSIMPAGTNNPIFPYLNTFLEGHKALLGLSINGHDFSEIGNCIIEKKNDSNLFDLSTWFRKTQP